MGSECIQPVLLVYRKEHGIFMKQPDAQLSGVVCVKRECGIMLYPGNNYNIAYC